MADLWESILSWHAEGYLLCCSTGTVRKKKAKGIADMHAYTLLTVSFPPLPFQSLSLSVSVYPCKTSHCLRAHTFSKLVAKVTPRNLPESSVRKSEAASVTGTGSLLVGSGKEAFPGVVQR